MRRNILFQVFKWVIIVSILFKSLQFLIRVYNIIIINLFFSDNEKYRGRLPFIIQELKIEVPLNYIITISFFITISIWLYLEYKKAHLRSGYQLSYKPVWALFSFIIPIFNLIAPYRIMNDLWTVSNRDISIESKGKNLIKAWWFLTIVVFVFSKYIGIQFDHASDLKEYLYLEYLSLLSFALSIHYYLLLNRLVKLLDI